MWENYETQIPKKVSAAATKKHKQWKYMILTSSVNSQLAVAKSNKLLSITITNYHINSELMFNFYF